MILGKNQDALFKAIRLNGERDASIVLLYNSCLKKDLVVFNYQDLIVRTASMAS